jgi:hypothetical protein
MDLKEIRWENMDRSHLVQDRAQWGALMNPVMSHRVS